jgi:fumarate hydratase subunit beta
MINITAPLTREARAGLKCGQEVLLTGAIYTARDAAHKELERLIHEKRRPVFDLKDAVIYYAGPTPCRPDGSFGSCGPTTSSRMDKFAPALLNMGVAAMIGKGSRSDSVKAAIRKHKAVYFLAIGGAGAYLAKRIKSSALVAFDNLGPEAIYRLEVEDLPLIVGIDSNGKDIYGNR